MNKKMTDQITPAPFPNICQGKSQSGSSPYGMPARPLVYAISLIILFGVMTDKKLQIRQAICVALAPFLRFHLRCAQVQMRGGSRCKPSTIGRIYHHHRS